MFMIALGVLLVFGSAGAIIVFDIAVAHTTYSVSAISVIELAELVGIHLVLVLVGIAGAILWAGGAISRATRFAASSR